MAVTGTYTNLDIVTSALRKIGVVAGDAAATSDDTETALRTLDFMFKAWQNKGYNLWTYAEQTLTLTTAASYTLSPERPIRILTARFVRTNGNEIPMYEMTRQEYDRLPDKDVTGTPTQYYYDRQRENALFYIWPLLSSASGETIKITYERELEDQTDLSAVPDVPGEWWEATVYNLAERLLDDFEIENPATVQRIARRAKMALDDALSMDKEESIFFAGPYADD